MTANMVELAGFPSAVGMPHTSSYRHAPWYFWAALGGIMAGFWSSFFRPDAPRNVIHSVCGITATF